MEQVQPAELSSVQMATAANEYSTLRECSVREDLYSIVLRCLTDVERNSFLLLIQEYKDVFSVNKDLGWTDRLWHSISTGNSHSIHQQLRYIPVGGGKEDA